MQGLSKAFNLGVVVCSPVTAQLVITKLKVSACAAARPVRCCADRSAVLCGLWHGAVRSVAQCCASCTASKDRLRGACAPLFEHLDF